VLSVSLFSVLLALPSSSSAQDVHKQVGSLTISVDRTHAVPGGVLVVHLRSRRALGTSYAILDGRRSPFLPSRRGPRALVPIVATGVPGRATLGVEIRGRRGRQRFPVPLTIDPRPFTARSFVIPDAKRSLLERPERTRDGRLLLAALRSFSRDKLWNGPFRPPVDATPADTFGAPTSYEGGSPVEAGMDGIYGEYHRGLDYAVPPGTIVQAPAAGKVVLAGAHVLTGNTLVLDHGQGIVSVLFHLGAVEVSVGDAVEARAPVAVSGDSGIAPSPHVHWGTYLHGVAVDPRMLSELLD
jgi:murein DD-endopeptidase MepM/ murein hydrolase activator NlpD